MSTKDYFYLKGNRKPSFVQRNVNGCEWCYWTLIFFHGKKRPNFFANDKDEKKVGITVKPAVPVRP